MLMKLLLASAMTMTTVGLMANPCDDRSLTVSSDPGDTGPWAVGVRTLQLGNLPTEVWYPVNPKDVQLAEKKIYDIRNQLPDREGKKIPDEQNPLQSCDCYSDLPIDNNQVNYPVIVFVHGTASFRTQALIQMTHWASRGFIVLSADHPRIRLKDILGPGGTIGAIFANQKRDTENLLKAIQNPPEALSFLDGRMDATRIGLSGHSAGGGAIGSFGNTPGVKILMPMASRGVESGQYLESVLFFGAERDGVGSYQSQIDGFESYRGEKRFVGLKNAGHLAFSEICFLGREDGGILEIASRNGVNIPDIVRRLGKDGCTEDYMSAEQGWEIINYASTAAFEEVLYCDASSGDAIENMDSQFPGLIDLF